MRDRQTECMDEHDNSNDNGNCTGRGHGNGTGNDDDDNTNNSMIHYSITFLCSVIFARYRKLGVRLTSTPQAWNAISAR